MESVFSHCASEDAADRGSVCLSRCVVFVGLVLGPGKREEVLRSETLSADCVTCPSSTMTDRRGWDVFGLPVP